MTMWKLIGAFGVFGAGCGIGWYYSRRLFCRYALLQTWETLCHYVSEQIRYGSAPIRDIWRSAAAQPVFESLSFLSSADTMRWKEEVCKVVLLYQNTVLYQEDVQVISEWIQGLGSSDLEGQTEHGLRYAERIARQCEKARERAERTGRLYTMLGALGGAAMVLLIW